MDKRELTAVSIAGIYLAACVWALWARLDAVPLLATASPLAASLTFPTGASMFTRMLLGALIDFILAVLAFVPVTRDLVDLGASAVAIVLLITPFKLFASSAPGGLACLAIYILLGFEAGFRPRQLFGIRISRSYCLRAHMAAER